ncbi:hypothetical protein AKJ16_DCAP17234 [Drosera capensis]
MSLQGNLVGGYRVLEEMEKAGVKPDYQTYSYLINNCKREKDIIKTSVPILTTISVAFQSAVTQSALSIVEMSSASSHCCNLVCTQI